MLQTGTCIFFGSFLLARRLPFIIGLLLKFVGDVPILPWRLRRNPKFDFLPLRRPFSSLLSTLTVLCLLVVFTVILSDSKFLVFCCVLLTSFCHWTLLTPVLNDNSSGLLAPLYVVSTFFFFLYDWMTDLLQFTIDDRFDSRCDTRCELSKEERTVLLWAFRSLVTLCLVVKPLWRRKLLFKLGEFLALPCRDINQY